MANKKRKHKKSLLSHKSKKPGEAIENLANKGTVDQNMERL